MERSSHDAFLTSLATAASFLCMVVSSTFGVTDALCGGTGVVAETTAAVLSGTAFAYYLNAST